jgi:HEAT repeat protein
MAPHIADGLASANASVRLIACNWVGAFGISSLARAVRGLLDDPDEAVRSRAARTLAQLGCDEAIPALLNMLLDRSSLRDGAFEALRRMNVSAITDALLRRPPQTVHARKEVLKLMAANTHPSQRSFILTCFRDANPEVRMGALAALTAQPSVEVTAIAPLLSDPSPEMRREILLLLGTLGTREARDVIVVQIEKDAETRAHAVRALAGLGDVTVAPYLMEIYPNTSPLVRLAIVETLAELRAPAAEPMIGALIMDPEAEIRRTAVVALSRVGTQSAMRHLRVAATDPSWEVRAAVAQVLNPVEPGASSVFERLCVDPNHAVASLAKQRLGLA